ncbi:MAG: polysaccharide biosynthesis/export family protein [Bacteroidales bacterium]|nr:polysaccharide biosynthesis/export family protein [Bacteroidales bacterium]MDY6075051.1 polysaccharide biosynthesis/export family protein [Bacteroidales bacterium]
MKKYFSEGLFFVVVGALLFMSSCVSQKKVLLLQKEQMLDSISSVEYVNKRVFDYKVQPGDNLYIRVSSMDKTFSEFFNSAGANSAYMSNSGGNSTGNATIYLNGYTVSDAGTIDFPYAGVVYVKDLTIEEIQQKIQDVIGEYQKETIVYVKLGVFNLTILGEVARPGQYQVYQSDINILQAMALAGNPTDYANKRDVKIVHQTTEGSQIVRVNINDADILSNPDYYLKPNDIIYVEPLGIKRYGFTSVPYSTIFSAASMLITCLTFFMMYLK